MIIKALSNGGKVRKINEDSYGFYICDEYAYAIVADGMGGYKAGEVASSMAVKAIEEFLKDKIVPELDRFQVQQILKMALTYANDEIFKYSSSNESVMGMGTTTTMCMIRDGYIIFAHVGDSRIYQIDDKIIQITRDHSYVQELVKLGMITPEQAKHHPHRNRITRAMGVEAEVNVDVGVKTYDGGRILLCSDGLYGEIEDEELQNISSSDSLETAVNRLVELALERGGADNITAVLMEGDKVDE